MSKDTRQILCGLVVAVLVNVGVQMAAMYRANAVFEWRISELEKKIEKYNGVREQVVVNAQETSQLDTRVAILETMHRNGGNDAQIPR
jgi:hypothetical protein